MRLKHVATVDFRRSELTNFEELVKKNASLKALKKDDVVLFLSRGGDQVVFVHGFNNVEGEKGTTSIFMESVKLRMIHGSTWNPLMIANYAKKVGIHLVGLKTFEEHYRELVEPVREKLLGA